MNSDEIDRELDAHLEHAIGDLTRAGMPPTTCGRGARRRHTDAARRDSDEVTIEVGRVGADIETLRRITKSYERLSIRRTTPRRSSQYRSPSRCCSGLEDSICAMLVPYWFGLASLGCNQQPLRFLTLGIFLRDLSHPQTPCQRSRLPIGTNLASE